MNKKFICISLAALMAVQTPIYLHSASMETTEFVWDEENAGNALFVWEANEWENYQDRLSLFGYVEPTAHADVDDAVRGLESTVKKVLNSDTTVGYGSFQKEHYTELILAMIDVLARQEGVVDTGSGETESLEAFQTWITSMGKYVSDTHNTENWTTEESIRQIFYRYTLSARAYANAFSDGKEPSLYEITDGLKSSVEGTVMHYSNTEDGFFSKEHKTYSETAAESYYESGHRTQIDAYYSGCTDYSPDPGFARKVMEIYSVSSGYGDTAYTEDMEKYVALAPNDKVKELLRFLVTCEGSRYVYGGSTPSGGIDCSHLVWYALNHTSGISVPYLTSGSFSGSSYYQSIPESDLMPGDVLWYEGHVAFYLGRNGDNYNTFEAWTENKPVGFNQKKQSRFKKYYRCRQLYK